STGLGNQRVTATLVVDDGSGDAMCRQRAQASTSITPKTPPPVECRKFDNLAIELQNTPDTTAYILIYAGRVSRMGQADALGRRTMDYMTTARGVDSRRVVIINGGYRDADFFEIWVCPPGAKPPAASPTVQESEVQPARERTRPRKPRRRG